MTTKTIRMKVSNTENILRQAVNEVPALGIAFGIIQNGLSNIAERAIKLNDPVLLWELHHIGCVECTEEELEKIENELKKLEKK